MRSLLLDLGDYPLVLEYQCPFCKVLPRPCLYFHIDLLTVKAIPHCTFSLKAPLSFRQYPAGTFKHMQPTLGSMLRWTHNRC